MNSIEDLLKQMTLKEPSPDLDDRVMASLTESPQRERSKSQVSWSHLLTACACLLAGFLIGRLAMPEASTDASNVAIQSTTPAIVPPQTPDQLASSKTRLGPESVVLFNGRPARTFDAVTHRTIHVLDEDTGQRHPVQVPTRRTIVTQTFGI